MAEIGTVLGAAQTLFAALESSILKDFFSSLGYKSDLEDLRSTVETVKSVLLDAAASEELNNKGRDYIQKLKTAVYDADDLFDEFCTLAQRKQQQLKEGNKLLEKVRLFFSSDNPLKIAYKLSREIKKTRKNLYGIARDHTNFGFTGDSSGLAVESKRIRNRREETCSYVNAPNVIGREADVEAIVQKLLDLNGEKGARFLTVVGIGGMGKTTLAQLVCADQRVQRGFSSKVWWICVADEENSSFDKKRILCNILDLATGSGHYHLSLEEVHRQFREELEGNKYLLVMDDVWTENKVKWMELKEFLMLGDAESRIMVTTRSHDVAKAIGNSDIHVLEGLSPENSWHLFEIIAFEEKPNSQANPFEVEIAKNIVRQCSNVPLAIKVVGSLLCGQGLDKWQTFEKSGLGGIRKGDNQIMSILKFSYHNLEPSLKSCFTFCAVFPKDYRIEKEMLIRHWMAHGYIVPFDRDQSIEKACEEHFLILLRRCFFEDVKMNKHGYVVSFKIHDLMHDVAQEVAGQEILVATTETSNLCAKVRHVFQGGCKREENFHCNIKVRSYLRIEPQSLRWRVLGLPHGGCLRTLTLVNVVMKTLPDSVGKLFHLRFLDLSGNGELETLPGSITKLHNLQTLKLQKCRRLRELPKKFRRLVNLMHLNIKGCSNIKYMPVGMDMLTSLCELTEFVVADESTSMDTQVGQLKDLKSLVNLKGRLDIKMQDDFKRAMVYDWEGSCLEGAEHLQKLCIHFHIDHSNYWEDNDVVNDEALLEKLLPHPNVNELYLRLYRGVKFPSWGRADFNWATLLPNLVNIRIMNCHKLKHLPSLSKLKHLRQLTLEGLDELEYIEDRNCSSSDVSLVSESKEEAEFTLFPSLEFLNIEEVPKLKGWWPGLEFTDSSSNARLWQQSFPRLSKFQFNCYSSKSKRNCMLPELWVGLGRADYLKSLPAGRLTKITLCDKELESLAEVGDVFKNCSSLRTLTLDICNKLSRLSGGLEHLTTLESLKIISCTQLNWEDGMPWRRFQHNLRSLRLYDHNLQNLPEGMQYLSSLEKLSIEMCHNLEELPGWISCFSSLQSLTIFNCKKLTSIPDGVHNMGSLKRLRIAYCSRELKARYQEPDGEDWHKIQHIPKIDIW